MRPIALLSPAPALVDVLAEPDAGDSLTVSRRETLRRAPTPPAPHRPRRRWGNRAMKFVRRAHLYAGLALVPFVILYGLTAFLFNHPGVWSASTSTWIPPLDLDAAGRTSLAAPGDLAQSVVAELEPGWTLDAATEPTLRGQTSLSATLGGTSYNVVFDQPGGGARVSTRSESRRTTPDELRPGDGSRFRVGQDALQSIQAAATALVLGERGDAAWRVRAAPRLEFGLLREGAPYRATYDLRDSTLRVVPNDEPPAARSLRSFLLRLHTAHGYPSGFGAAFWWAILVDAMAVAMVAWAITGLFMWWQMKNLRRVGAVVVVVCALGTTALFAGQWARLG